MEAIEIQNFQGEPLGKIFDLGIDLIHGRIVEVLVLTLQSPDGPAKIVAVPPLALIPDPTRQIFSLDISRERFNAAPFVDLSSWQDAGRHRRIAAAYRYFGQEPYFLEDGAIASPTAARPKVRLGYVERSSKIVGLPVGNPQGDNFGQVASLTLKITDGRILNVIVLAPGKLKTKSVIPAMALSFNERRDALLLDDSKIVYGNEPRYIFVVTGKNNDRESEEEAYSGAHTSVALVQGASDRDVDLATLIEKNIRAAKLAGLQLEVSADNGRVTLRGTARTVEDRGQVDEIAVSAARVENVDNQVLVAAPASGN
jgi:sporulation protein YlmC with PRC-barrel domain